MPTIEILGTPRSGKTESIHKIFDDSPNSCIFEERFDLEPYPQSDLFNYNFWYARYVIKNLTESRKNKRVCIFDRGVIDRLVFCKALFEYGIFSDSQYKKYMEYVEPFVSKEDFGLIIIISPQQSMQQTKSNKWNITRDIKFLKILNKFYFWAAQTFPNYSVIKPIIKNYSLKDLLVEKINLILDKHL